LNNNEPVSKGHLLLCPICNSKTRTKVMPDTILINFPLFCPKCKQEALINVKNQILTKILIKVPAA